MRNQGMPNRFEIVVCKVVKIFTNSALVELLEYRKKGLIHVSEIALRWVKDIREFVKPNQHIVCQVLGVDGDDINLSLKRVRKPDAERKLNEFKRERKAEKTLELVAKEKGKTLDDAYNEVGYMLQEEFGSIHKALDFALKNPELLKSKGVPKAWMDPILKVIQKSYSEKVYEVRAKLRLVCYGPDGISTIKKALSTAKREGVESSYISAPNYMIIGRGKNFKEIRSAVKEIAEGISKEIISNKGTCEFEIIESK
jgi:translation initiation factor 2 subunit 1